MKTFSLRGIAQKIAFSTTVQGLSKIGQLILSALTIKIISNFLSNSDIGIYEKISEFALFFSVIGNLGIFGNTVRAMSDTSHDKNTFMNLLVLRIITLLPFFVIGLLLGVGVAHFSSSQILAITLLFIAFLADGIRSVAEAALQAQYRIERASVILIIGNIIEYGLIFLLASKSGMEGAPLGLILIFSATCLASLAMAGSMLIAVKELVTWRFKLHYNHLKGILTQSLPFGLINICNNIYFRFAPQYFIAGILSNEQFGSFSMSLRLSNVAALFSTFLMFSVFPGFRHYIDAGEWQKAHKVYKAAAWILGVSGIALVLIGTFVGPYALEILTKKQLILPELWFVLPLALFLAALSYGYDLILLTLFAFGEEKWLLKREIIAVMLGMLIFLSSRSFLMPLNVMAILGGSIIAESFIVIVAIGKISKIFRQKKEKQKIGEVKAIPKLL